MLPVHLIHVIRDISKSWIWKLAKPCSFWCQLSNRPVLCVLGMLVVEVPVVLQSAFPQCCWFAACALVAKVFLSDPSTCTDVRETSLLYNIYCVRPRSSAPPLTHSTIRHTQTAAVFVCLFVCLCISQDFQFYEEKQSNNNAYWVSVSMATCSVTIDRQLILRVTIFRQFTLSL